MSHILSYDNYTKSKRHYVFNSVLVDTKNTYILKLINKQFGTLHILTLDYLKTTVNNLKSNKLLEYFTYIEGKIKNKIFFFDIDQEKYIDVEQYNVGESYEEFDLFRILEIIYSPTEIFNIVNEIEGNKTNKNNIKVIDIHINNLDKLLVYSVEHNVNRNKFVYNPICTTARNRFFGKPFDRALEMYKPYLKTKENPELHLFVTLQ